MVNRAEWLTSLSKVISEAGNSTECPNCASGHLEVRYVVDLDSRIGFVLFWCNACLYGISVSRARAPQGLPVKSIADPDALAGVPEFTRIN